MGILEISLLILLGVVMLSLGTYITVRMLIPLWFNIKIQYTNAFMQTVAKAAEQMKGVFGKKEN